MILYHDGGTLKNHKSLLCSIAGSATGLAIFIVSGMAFNFPSLHDILEKELFWITDIGLQKPETLIWIIEFFIYLLFMVAGWYLGSLFYLLITKFKNLLLKN